MLRRLLVGLISLHCVAGPAYAEDAGQNAPSPAGASAPLALAGDHWTYEVRDEISGAIKFTRTDMVTDIANNAITVRVDFANTGRSTTIFYDSAWNILHDGPFRYSPNDGTGFHLPLTVGAQWKFAADVINSSNGQTFRRTGNSRVTGQDKITTKAGTFDVFVVETDYVGKNVQDPTLVNQTTSRSWFSPDVNHWIKRNFVIRQRGHVVQNNTIELIDYGRKKQ